MKEIEFDDGGTLNILSMSDNKHCVILDDGEGGLAYIRLTGINALIKALKEFQGANNV